MKRIHSFCLCCKADHSLQPRLRPLGCNHGHGGARDADHEEAEAKPTPQPRRDSLPRGLGLPRGLLLLGGSQARQPLPHRRGLPLPLRADLRFEALHLLHVPRHDLLTNTTN